MRIMNILFLLSIALLPINLAFGADPPFYKDGLLTIPSVNTAEQVGKYQDATFRLTEQGLWQLLSVKAIGGADPNVIGTSGIALLLIDMVEVVKVDSFPVQVFLRVSGALSPCFNSSLGQINQRLEHNRFDITITFNFFVDHDPLLSPCLAYSVAFAKTIPLAVYGLSSGVYSYSVNNGANPSGMSIIGGAGTFELTTDNKLPGDY